MSDQELAGNDENQEHERTLMETLDDRRDVLRLAHEEGRVLHDYRDPADKTCPECSEPWPCAEKRRQKEEIRWMVDLLKSDLYERAPLLDTDPKGMRFTSPIGWSVWMTHGFGSVVVTIRDPKGEHFASTTSGSREWLHEVLP